jgi:hypothetical protein
MERTFRPKSNFVWAAVALLLILMYAANSVVVSTSAVQTAIELAVCCVLGVLAYAIWIRPKLVLKETVIEVVNPFRTEVIPCADVRELDTKWALTIVHGRGKTRVWVAPASGKRRWIADTTFGWYGRGIPLTDSRGNESSSMSESLASSSGQAAYMIREHLKRLH